MATGMQTAGAIAAYPDVPTLGMSTWAEMSGMHPDNPLVGGHGSPSQRFDTDATYGTPRRMVSEQIAEPLPNAPQQGHWTELLNFRGNPVAWVALAAIAYLGLVHLHVNAKVGPYRGSVGVGQ